MYQAIVTRFIGATNHRQNRVKAVSQAGSKTINWDSDLDVVANHRLAAIALASHLDWGTDWVGGASPDGLGYCWVLRSTPHG